MNISGTNRSQQQEAVASAFESLSGPERDLLAKKIFGAALTPLEQTSHTYLMHSNASYQTAYANKHILGANSPQSKKTNQVATSQPVFKKATPRSTPPTPQSHAPRGTQTPVQTTSSAQGKAQADRFLSNWMNSPVDNSPKTWQIDWNKPAIFSFGTYDKVDGIKPKGWTANKLTEFGRTSRSNYLSNYYMPPGGITIDGQKYKSVEHYYQAAKFIKRDQNGRVVKDRNGNLEFTDKSRYDRILSAGTANEARDIAAEHPKPSTTITHDDALMSRVMKKALYAKYTNPDGSPNALGRDLIATGNRLLVEGNKRGDKGDDRWGAVFDFNGPASLTGKNMLGTMLMELRDELKTR